MENYKMNSMEPSECVKGIEISEAEKVNIKEENEDFILDEINSDPGQIHQVFVKVENEVSLDISDMQIPSAVHEMDLHDNSKDHEMSKCLKDANCGRINYLEYHKSERLHNACKVDIKQEPEEVENWLEKRSNGSMNWNGSIDALMEVEIKNDNDEEDINDRGECGIKIEEGVRCHHCGEMRLTKDELKKHIYSMHLSLFVDDLNGEDSDKHKKHRCSFCYREFVLKTCLEKHVQIHTGLRLYKCEHSEPSSSVEDGEILGNISIYNGHLSYKDFDGEKSEERGTGQASVFCVSDAELICTEKQGNSKLSGRQTASAWRNDLYSYICDICRKICKSKQDLGRHMRIHYDDRPFGCRLCDKRFKRQNERGRHELLHLRNENVSKREKMYTCGTCGKQYTKGDSLYCHSITHTNKFACSACGKCFNNNANLQKHLRTHTKEKPFKCDICQKCFTQKGYLKGHVASHSSEKQFSCTICFKMFKWKSAMTRHKLTHLKKV